MHSYRPAIFATNNAARFFCFGVSVGDFFFFLEEEEEGFGRVFTFGFDFTMAVSVG
jgi:hypothetical protein